MAKTPAKGTSKKHDDQFYQRIVEEALTGILVFSQKTRACVFANPLARSLLDFQKPTEIENMTLSELSPKTAEKRITCFNEELLQHEGFYQEVMLQKQNGLYLIANLGVKHFKIAHEDHVLLIIQDITLQKKLQREVTEKQAEIHRALANLTVQNKQLRELDLAKNRFIALTTHELRTPLSALVASAEVLQMGLYDNKEQLNEFVDLIVEQGRHLSRLVNDVLDFTKIQAGKMDYYVGLSDVVPLIKARVENFKNMASYAEVRVEVDIDESAKFECYFDELRLQQVFDNTFNNAIKYNVPHGKVRVYLEENEELVKLFIEDTGRGIESHQLEKVFDEFEMLGQVAEHHQGTGLGMPISRRMMESMGGKIKVKSKIGLGSTFWLEIPKTRVLDINSYRSRVKKIAA